MNLTKHFASCALALTALLISQPAFAAEKPAKTPAKMTSKSSDENPTAIRYGFRAAAGIGGFNFHKEDDLGFGISASAGFVAVIPPLPMFSGIPVVRSIGIVPGIQYGMQLASMDKTNSDPNLGDETHTMDVSLQSVTVPVLFRYKNKLINPLYVEAGPQFGFILSSNTESEFKSDLSPLDNYKTDGDTEDLNRFQVGAALGIGYSISKHMTADLRYSFSALSYADNTNGRPYTLQLGFGYLL